MIGSGMLTLGRYRINFGSSSSAIVDFDRMGSQVGPDALDGPLDTYTLEIVCSHTDEAFPETICLYGLHVG